MTKKNNQHECLQNNNNNIKSNSELQKVIHSGDNSSDAWDKYWRQGITPWDLGQATPIILHLHRTGDLPKGTALVPGCGSGYDVVAMACPERYVFGLDISEHAINKALELSASSPNADFFTFMKTDFFTWNPPELFFCALEPHMRSAWAQKTCNLLKRSGELITLMFPVTISDHVGGTPYKVSVSDYEEVLHPLGFEAVSVVDNEMAIGRRKGKEKLGRWRKSVKKSSL